MHSNFCYEYMFNNPPKTCLMCTMKVDGWFQVVVGEVNNPYESISQLGKNMPNGLPPSKPKAKLKLN